MTGNARGSFSSAFKRHRITFFLILAISIAQQPAHAQEVETHSDSISQIPLTEYPSANPAHGKYSDTLVVNQQKRRKWIIGGIQTVAYGSTLIILNNTWYTGYARTKFQAFNDSREWLQVDKLGHAWGAYNASMASAAMWRWAGIPRKKAALFGAIGSTAFLTGIELMDAHSAKWGWSWSDMAANLGGAGLLLAQEYAWGEQRIQFKFSFHPRKYSDPQLDQRADNLFGNPWQERMLKDYNAQTYWLSANLRSFFPESRMPRWLNVSIGYGADGMFGGFENKWLDQLGNEINRSDIQRKRQFYLAPDVSFARIPTDKAWLRTIFTILDVFKFPAPALMMDSKGKFRFYPCYF
ncbi:MAG: DUF2279 domain-containing protein [Chitinophagaceae bacterium]|nr:DUF2279 domain-containing protein [Chitinophagaceae bacterium]